MKRYGTVAVFGAILLVVAGCGGQRGGENGAAATEPTSCEVTSDARLSIATGNNLAGIFASEVSGETGMTTTSALSGYTFGFWALVIPGVLLFVVAPLINKLMHGVK